MPIAHATKPSGIDVKHVHSKIGGIANHAQRNLLIDSHAATPAVIHHPWIICIFPGFGIAKNGAQPFTQYVSGALGTLVKTTEKNDRRLKNFAWLKARAEWSGIAIQTECSLERIFFAGQGNSSSTAKLDSGVPAGRRIVAFDQQPRNYFSRLIITKVAVSSGCAYPVIAICHCNLMGTNGRRPIGAFLDERCS